MHARSRARAELSSDVDCRWAEIESGDIRSEACERERVSSDVALEMHDREAGDVTESREIEPNDIGDVPWVRAKVLEAVFGA